MLLISCNEQARYSISFDENYINSSTKDFLLLDEFSDYIFMPRFNNVKSIRYTISDAEMKFGEYIAGEIYEVYDFEYSNNNLQKITVYDETGEIYLIGRYEYKDGQNISQESICDEDEVLVKYSYKYTPNKIVVNEKYDNEAGVDLIIIIDENNRILERYWSDDEEDKISIKYGINNKVSRLTNQRRSQIVDFKYDSNNRITEVIPWGLKFFYNDERLAYIESSDDNRRIEYIYDSSNLPTRVLFKDNVGGEGQVIDIIVEFDE